MKTFLHNNKLTFKKELIKQYELISQKQQFYDKTIFLQQREMVYYLKLFLDFFATHFKNLEISNLLLYTQTFFCDDDFNNRIIFLQNKVNDNNLPNQYVLKHRISQFLKQCELQHNLQEFINGGFKWVIWYNSVLNTELRNIVCIFKPNELSGVEEAGGGGGLTLDLSPEISFQPTQTPTEDATFNDRFDLSRINQQEEKVIESIYENEFKFDPAFCLLDSTNTNLLKPSDFVLQVQSFKNHDVLSTNTINNILLRLDKVISEIKAVVIKAPKVKNKDFVVSNATKLSQTPEVIKHTDDVKKQGGFEDPAIKLNGIYTNNNITEQKPPVKQNAPENNQQPQEPEYFVFKAYNLEPFKKHHIHSNKPKKR